MNDQPAAGGGGAPVGPSPEVEREREEQARQTRVDQFMSKQSKGVAAPCASKSKWTPRASPPAEPSSVGKPPGLLLAAKLLLQVRVRDVRAEALRAGNARERIVQRRERAHGGSLGSAPGIVEAWQHPRSRL